MRLLVIQKAIQTLIPNDSCQSYDKYHPLSPTKGPYHGLRHFWAQMHANQCYDSNISYGLSTILIM